MGPRPRPRRHVPAPVSYRTWAPPGRALHLVDLENLAGWATCSPRRLAAVAAVLRRVGKVRPGDHVVVATNPRQLVAAAAAFPGARLLVAEGPNGADRALLAVAGARDVAQRYDRLVVLSGDHCFTTLAAAVRALGCEVHVVAHRRSLSRRLAEAGSQVHLLAG